MFSLLLGWTELGPYETTSGAPGGGVAQVGSKGAWRSYNGDRAVVSMLMVVVGRGALGSVCVGIYRVEVLVAAGARARPVSARLERRRELLFQMEVYLNLGIIIVLII